MLVVAIDFVWLAMQSSPPPLTAFGAPATLGLARPIFATPRRVPADAKRFHLKSEGATWTGVGKGPRCNIPAVFGLRSLVFGFRYLVIGIWSSVFSLWSLVTTLHYHSF